MTTRQIAFLSAAYLLLAVQGIAAQENVDLRPVGDHLAEIEQDSIGSIRYVAMRCGALYALVSGQVEDQEPQLSEQFFESGARFLTLAVEANRTLGATHAESVQFASSTMEDIAGLYRERMRRNMAARGSHFVDDPLIAGDMDTCRRLAESLWGATR